MNLKKLQRQLFAAVFSLMLGTITLTVSTYAWFILNQTVKADGISINAQTDGVNFEISTDGNNFPAGQTTATYQNLNASLYPVNPTINDEYALSAPANWYHGFSDAYDNARTDIVGSLLTTTVDYTNHLLKADGNNYALIASYYVRLSDGTANGVTIDNIKVTDVSITGASNLLSCVQLLVATDESAVIVENGMTISDVIINSVTTSDPEPYQIDVYAYFNGRNEDCKSSNYDNINLNVSLSFQGTVNNNK